MWTMLFFFLLFSSAMKIDMIQLPDSLYYYPLYFININIKLKLMILATV